MGVLSVFVGRAENFGVPGVHFLVADGGATACFVLGFDLGADGLELRVVLGQVRAVVGVDPVFDARGPGFIGYRHADGPIEYYRAVEAYATSYSPCRLGVDYCSSRTASGATLQKGVIGVIRSWYNVMRGQPVYIPGYGFATIEDIGAGFSDRHWVDLGYTDEDWVSWSRYVTVYFLTPVPANIMWILE